MLGWGGAIESITVTVIRFIENLFIMRQKLV